MSFEFLLDSNICIYLLEGKSPEAMARVQAVKRSTLCVSSIVYAEVMLGMELTDQVELGERFFAKLAVVPFSLEAAARYAQLPFKRASFDRLIAAHALSMELTLITNNTSDFFDIPGLRVENWTAE